MNWAWCSPVADIANTTNAGGNLRSIREIEDTRILPEARLYIDGEPICIVDVANDMRIAREEIFGPVLVFIPFADEEDAIRIANDSDYGLSGGKASGDPTRAAVISRRLRTGSVGIDGGICIMGDIPFGDCKSSGMGREWGVEDIEEFLQSKVLATPVMN